MFVGIGGDQVQFDDKGDGIGKYDVFQYQHIADGRYDYVKIGEWIDRYGINQKVKVGNDLLGNDAIKNKLPLHKPRGGKKPK